MIFDGNQNRPALAQTEDDPSCVLTNLISEEVPQLGGREERVFMLPNGAEVILQRVNIRTTGTVTITLEDDTTGSADFTVCESYYLCAPMGTEIIVQITNASCHICSIAFSEEGTEVSVDIDFCQDVQSTASVVLDIEASFCNPREQVERSCPNPTRPPQCLVRFNNENDSLKEDCLVPCPIPSHPSPQQEENLCIRTENVYDWVQNRVDTTVTITLPPPLPLFCVYEITELTGECTDLVLGDVVCFPCESPCDETLQCSNDGCTLVLSLTDNACVDCPPDVVTLPQGFSCEVTDLSRLYEVTSVEEECGDLVVGNLICFPSEAPCAETLEGTSEECIAFPPDAVKFPADIAYSHIGGRIFNVDQQTFYDVLNAAIDDANSGDTLILTPSEYTQDAELIVDKTLTIRGFSAGQTEIVFPPAFTAETAISLQADNIILEGLSMSRTSTGVADETLVRIPPRGIGDYYSGITIQNSILTGGKRTMIVNVEDFTLRNNTLNHTGTEKALEIRGALGTTTITGNSFMGGATSLGAIYVQGATPNDIYFSGSFIIDDNTMARHSQFVFFSTASFNNVSIFVRRNVINHMDRAGSSIIFEPFNFPGVDTILIEENDITNPNTQRLAVYVDYRDGGTTAPDPGQIQVIRNTLNVATPWGRAFDTVSPDAPVGFTTTGAMVGMSLAAFDLVDNVIVT